MRGGGGGGPPSDRAPSSLTSYNAALAGGGGGGRRIRGPRAAPAINSEVHFPSLGGGGSDSKKR